MRAFRLMNSAILMQMYDMKPNGINLDIHVLRNFYTNNKMDLNNLRWRGFQLGFILLNLDAFIENSRIVYLKRCNVGFVRIVFLFYLQVFFANQHFAN